MRILGNVGMEGTKFSGAHQEASLPPSSSFGPPSRAGDPSILAQPTGGQSSQPPSIPAERAEGPRVATATGYQLLGRMRRGREAAGLAAESPQCAGPAAAPTARRPGAFLSALQSRGGQGGCAGAAVWSPSFPALSTSHLQTRGVSPVAPPACCTSDTADPPRQGLSCVCSLAPPHKCPPSTVIPSL